MPPRTRTFLRILSEDTIFLPLSLCVILSGGIIWITNLAFQVSANSQALSSLEKNQIKRDAELNDKFEQIMGDLGFIRGRMEAGTNATKGGRKRNVQD